MSLLPKSELSSHYPSTVATGQPDFVSDLFGNPKDRFTRDMVTMVLETLGEMARTLGQFDTLRKAPTQFGDKLLNNTVH